MRTPALLFLLALAVRAVLVALYPDPAYPDSYYYFHLGQQLAAGHGFVADYIWNFVDAGGRLPLVPTLPIPSNAHWMPLAELIQVPFLILMGTGAVAASSFHHDHSRLLICAHTLRPGRALGTGETPVSRGHGGCL